MTDPDEFPVMWTQLATLHLSEAESWASLVRVLLAVASFGAGVAVSLAPILDAWWLLLLALGAAVLVGITVARINRRRAECLDRVRELVLEHERQAVARW